MKSAVILMYLFVVVASSAATTDSVSADQSARDPRIREYVPPSRVLWQSAAESCVVQGAKSLLQPFSGQLTLDNRAGCVMRNYGKPPGILLDFGRELHGGVQIAVADLEPVSRQSKTVNLRVRFGESASEAMSELGGESDATNDHAVRDATVTVPWLGTAEVGNTGFRFVRLDLVETNSSVTIKAVRAVFLHRDLERLGTFRCNDERLNRIWDTGAYTVFLNLQNFVWDGIKRDRLVWIGDMHPETSTIGVVFGGLPIVPASLDLIRNDTPLPKWMNGISSYSLWWLIIQRDWFSYTGDLNYLRQQQPYMTGLLDQLTRYIGPDGSETLAEMRFLDWPSSEDKAAIHAGLQSLLVLAFQAGADMARAMGDATTERLCAEVVSRLRKHHPEPGNSKQAAALMVLAGLGDARRLNRDVMAVDGAKRLSTFYGYYVLQARAKAADYQGCLDVIRQFWGAMLDLGATTFWEDFNLDWLPNAGRIDELVAPGKRDIHGDYGAYCYKGFRHSLCHGWASGPTAWLSQNVLGVQILEPGCKRVKIEPQLGDLAWVEGTFPTPQGVIKIRHEKLANGKLKSDVQAPPGIKIEGL
jgi:hypothetical protein